MLTPVCGLCVGTADGELIQRADIVVTYSWDLTVSVCADIHQQWKLYRTKGRWNQQSVMLSSRFHPVTHHNVSYWGLQRLSCTWRADVGWNGHIWAETQEVAFVGLLILITVWHWPHTANWQQRLMGGGTEIQIRHVAWGGICSCLSPSYHPLTDD